MKFESLPDDLLLEIVSRLSVPDILRLRQVSRQFQCLTCERTVWFNAYRNSTILRPLGPFPSQSAEHLERELKKSIQLHANWTSTDPQPVSQRIVNTGEPLYTRALELVLGRYLLVLGSKELRCFDLDSDVDKLSEPIGSYTLLINHYYHPIILTYVDEINRGHESPLSIVCALLFPGSREYTIKLLSLHILYGTARFELKNEVCIPLHSPPRQGTLAEKFLVINEVGDPKMVHIPTGQLYYLPPPNFESLLNMRTTYVLTPTHLLVQSGVYQYILEAFLLPDDIPEVTQERTVLVRSHFVFHPLGIAKMFLLSSHTTHTNSYSNEDQQDFSKGSSSHDTISMTFLAPITMGGGLQVGLLDIVLEPPAVDKDSMSVTWTPGPDKIIDEYVSSWGTMQGGCARIIASTGWDRDDFPVFTAYTVNSDRVIMATDVEISYGQRTWDGLTGRLCTVVSQGITIEDFV